MVIDSILYQLLQSHECVIVPNFGGFIVRESPCTLNAAKDRIKPFSKTVFFNQHLKENDGLLATELSKINDNTYGKALLQIEEWVANANLSIISENKANIGELGIFYKGNEDNKWFSPNLNLNLALKSYGLKAVDIKVIANEAIENETLEKTYEPILTIADRAPIEKLQLPKKNWKAWAAAASIAMVAHIGYLSVEHYAANTQKASIVNLPTIKMEEKIVEKPIVETIELQNIEPIQTPIKEIVTIPQVEITTPTIVEETPIVKIELFSIGKYRLEQNALNHQTDLAKKGITSTIESQNGLFNVMIENSNKVK